MSNKYEFLFHHRNKPSSIEIFAETDEEAIDWLIVLAESINEKRFKLYKRTKTDITPD